MDDGSSVLVVTVMGGGCRAERCGCDSREDDSSVSMLTEEEGWSCLSRLVIAEEIGVFPCCVRRSFARGGAEGSGGGVSDISSLFVASDCGMDLLPEERDGSFGTNSTGREDMGETPTSIGLSGSFSADSWALKCIFTTLCL